MKNIKRGRVIFLFVLVLCICAVFIARLFQLQIIDGKAYRERSVNTIVSTSVIKASRGSILDRYGTPLAQDKQTMSVIVDRTLAEDINAELCRLVEIFDSSEDEYINTFPISYSESEGYSFDESYSEEETAAALTGYLESKDIDPAASAAEIAEQLAEYYELEGYTSAQAAGIIGARYELEQRGVGNVFTFAEDISIQTATMIKENASALKSVSVEQIPTRVYSYENSCSHVLGYVGRIYASEYDQLREQGYKLDDIVGKSGIEKIYEPYLRGKDGSQSVSKDSDGVITSVISSTEAVSGSDVILTVDSRMQLIVEDALQRLVRNVRALNGDSAATSASVVIMDPDNGQVLSLANYPTFNLSTYYEDYDILSKDESSPYVNRAIAGLYPPGSTFKMVTATAALETGAVNASTIYDCTGRYTYYNDYQPACFNSTAHGEVDVIEAIKRSCNSYFFDAVRLTGIDKLVSYAELYGFGSVTGIELSGELPGIIAGPEYRYSQDGTWNSGDTLLAGIGQSDNLVTPMQLAVYTSAVANGGTRYTPHIVHSVRDSLTGEILQQSVPEGVSLGISASTMQLIRDGMYACAQEQGGSAYNSFADYTATTVCAKTGTAEYASELPTALLVGYAPAEDPEIAFVVVVEHSGTSVTRYLASLVKEVLNYYFSSQAQTAG